MSSAAPGPQTRHAAQRANAIHEQRVNWRDMSQPPAWKLVGPSAQTVPRDGVVGDIPDGGGEWVEVLRRLARRYAAASAVRQAYSLTATGASINAAACGPAHLGSKARWQVCW